MATLTIVIKGIALIIEQNGTWKVFMPFLGCHKAVLTKEGELKPGIPLAHSGQKLAVTGKNLSELAKGPNFDQVFDITDRDAHQDGVRLKFDWEIRTVEFTIPGGTYSAEISNSPFVLNKVTSGGGSTAVKNLGAIGTIGTIVLEGEDLKLVAEGQENFTKEFPEDATIILDNDCHGIVDPTVEDSEGEKAAFGPSGKDNNVDFQMLYLTIEDAVDRTRKFQVQSGGDPAELPCNNHKVTKLV